MKKVEKNILKKIYSPRKGEAHKYDFGLLLVVGGGEFYTGSPALAALAAFRSGVDMVQILAPKRAADIIASFSPNLAAYPFKGDWFDEEDLPVLLSMTDRAKVVAKGKTAFVIGGGMGRSEETKRTIVRYLEQIDIKGVIDADGLHAVAKKKEVIKGKKFILTPHYFEFYILTSKNIAHLSLQDKANIVLKEAKKLGCVILLKGEKDIISDGKEVVINETGSPYLSVGGTGDTLAGICGSLLAQGVPPFLAAQGAAFLNGKAGERAAKNFGPSLTATDLIENLPFVLKQFLKF